MSVRSMVSRATWSTALLTACSADSIQVPDARHFTRVGGAPAASVSGEWSEPVNLGPPISAAGVDQSPELSANGQSLYFSSARPGGVGGNDIWVSHRACTQCPWDEPINLGPTINSSAGDAGPSLSADERIMFFTSARAGVGLNDIYMTRRSDPTNDFGWETPVLVGTGVVSTAAYEHAPLFVDGGGDGTALYFTRGILNGAGNDLYRVAVTRHGEIEGTPVPVEEFNAPESNEGMITVSRDGREAIFASDRPLPHVRVTLYTSSRQTPHSPWSEPVSLASVTPLGTPNGAIHPRLSHDGRTLLFASARPGTLGNLDIWMTTRAR